MSERLGNARWRYRHLNTYGDNSEDAGPRPLRWWEYVLAFVAAACLLCATLSMPETAAAQKAAAWRQAHAGR
jgi:hypothetical protein